MMINATISTRSSVSFFSAKVLGISIKSPIQRLVDASLGGYPLVGTVSTSVMRSLEQAG